MRQLAWSFLQHGGASCQRQIIAPCSTSVAEICWLGNFGQPLPEDCRSRGSARSGTSKGNKPPTMGRHPESPPQAGCQRVTTQAPRQNGRMGAACNSTEKLEDIA